MHHLGYYTAELVQTFFEPLGATFHTRIDEYIKLVNESMAFMKNVTDMEAMNSVDAIEALSNYKQAVANKTVRFANESEYYFVKPENYTMAKQLALTTLQESSAAQVS